MKRKLEYFNAIREAQFQCMEMDSSVYLMGLVTEEEADIATDIARRVENVDRVVKAFEYIKTEAGTATTADKTSPATLKDRDEIEEAPVDTLSLPDLDAPQTRQEAPAQVEDAAAQTLDTSDGVSVQPLLVEEIEIIPEQEVVESEENVTETFEDESSKDVAKEEEKDEKVPEEKVEKEIESTKEEVEKTEDKPDKTNETGAEGKEGETKDPQNANQGDKMDKRGDQGNEKGDIDARSLYGNPGGGGGTALEMAGWIWDFKPAPDDTSSEEGRIVFQIQDSRFQVQNLKLHFLVFFRALRDFVVRFLISFRGTLRDVSGPFESKATL